MSQLSQPGPGNRECHGHLNKNILVKRLAAPMDRATAGEWTEAY